MLDVRFTSEITVKPVQSMGGDHMVVAAAKVSTSGDEAMKFASEENAEANAGLIGYLMRYRHGTPFEHSAVTFFVHAPAFVWWEWVRHRIGFSYNIESGRYKVLEPVFWVPRPDRKMIPAPDHKPSRPKFVVAARYEFLDVEGEMRVACLRAYEAYQRILGVGVASEVARSVLPFSVYYSGWVTCNPRSLMAFLSLRTHEPDATFISYPQAEIEEAARATEEILKTGWPLTHAAFCGNGRVGP